MSDTELATAERRGHRFALAYLLTVALPAGLAVGAVVLFASSRGGGGAADQAGGHLVLYHLLIAIAAAVGAAAAGGALARRVGQPAVVGELVAGLALGPSVLGLLLPSVQQWLFPASILTYLQALAQIGVVLFMFLIGCELDWRMLRRGGSRSIAVGHAAIAVPLFVGVVLALLLPASLRPPNIADVPFVLFVAICLAISAFPVLARILTEQNLLNTQLGTTGMTAAGVGDVTAWCLLVAVVAFVRGTSAWSAAWTVLLVAVLTVAMFTVVRPILARVAARAEQDGSRRAAWFALVIVILMAAAAITEFIGAHALFGAFLAGLVMPRRSAVATELTGKLEGVAIWVLLPLFFVTFGLQLRMTSIDVAETWWITVVIVLLAIGSKIGGAAAAAAATGADRREGLALGVMMNCRGLTELIVLSVGLQLGVLTPALFAMFVVMALLTTAMTGPLLRRVLAVNVDEKGDHDAVPPFGDRPHR